MLMERMVRNNTQYLPVVNGTTVFGMISISEVVKMRLKKNNAPSLEHFTRHLKPRQQYA
jgi:predicted transcriptional regulator